MVFYYFFQKSLFTENYFLIAAINLATRGPLYTCLVLIYIHLLVNYNPVRKLCRLSFFTLSCEIQNFQIFNLLHCKYMLVQPLE